LGDSDGSGGGDRKVESSFDESPVNVLRTKCSNPYHERFEGILQGSGFEVCRYLIATVPIFVGGLAGGGRGLGDDGPWRELAVVRLKVPNASEEVAEGLQGSTHRGCHQDGIGTAPAMFKRVWSSHMEFADTAKMTEFCQPCRENETELLGYSEKLVYFFFFAGQEREADSPPICWVMRVRA
jgi:hypothetical protein